CAAKSNISNNNADESLFSQDLETGRSSYEHAALRCDRTTDGERRGEGTEADQRGWFEFYFKRSPQLTTRCRLCKLFRSRAVRDKSEMNLYSSFGNLMEAWVTKEDQCLDSAWLGNNDEDPTTPSTHVGTNLPAESEDSGVETASSVTSFTATFSSVFMENAEMDTFAPETEVGGLTPALTSQSPVSSSSPRLCPSRVQEDATALHLKVELALQKTEAKCLKNNREPLTVDGMLRQPPRASFLPKRHTSDLVRGQRSESFSLRRTVNPSVSTRQMSEMRRILQPVTSLSAVRGIVNQSAQDLGKEERNGLSPGFCYLEHVCQKLEEIARKQMHSRALQMEKDAQWEHQDMEALDTCQSDLKAAEEALSSCQIPEDTERAEHSEPRQRNPYRHFRQRSASDTNITALQFMYRKCVCLCACVRVLGAGRLNADCRGQHLTDDLLEKVEEGHVIQENEKKETSKTGRNWKLKFGSLKREPAVGDTKGQQMHSSEKNSARRRLSQLLRRSRKTLPVS
ncbi:hypothetical protein FQN60_008022, partial [Etheostoma spectabile]